MVKADDQAPPAASLLLWFAEVCMNRTLGALLLAVVSVSGCNREKVTSTAEGVAQGAGNAAQRAAENIEARLSGESPVRARVTREEIERQRFNLEWQKLRSFQQAGRRGARPIQQPERVRLQFVQEAKFSETLDAASLQSVDTLPVRVPIRGDVGGPSVLRAQVLLDRLMYSPGVIDGRWGKNTAISVYWFQRENGLDTTGEIDEATFRALTRLADYPPALVEHRLTADDVAGPFTRIPDDVYEQEKLECLCYESLGEKLAEKYHTTPEVLELLNPGMDLDRLPAGQRIRGLNVRPPQPQGAQPDLQRLVVSVEGNYLHGLRSDGTVGFHAPTTVGSKYDPSPSDTLKIVGIAQRPHFHYQPRLFQEVPDTDPEAHLQPGPNSPVGVVWMALSKPHYGIHGTGDPESIGYASSHGCIRLTNWDAADLSRGVQPGNLVDFVDTRH